ncbi:MAG: glycerophosphodiester phosphodiesterase family protein, partial [Clostridia bacterium]|nr:glycerophosphodiester phosphodiesterase family protein [Clostridia bacterium]
LCAHRGVWGGNIPCNNLLAYDIALAQGADMVEIDVTMAGDGELFIFHPHMERRHIGKDVHLEDMTTEEIKKLRYCNYDGSETEIGLNTLDELLEHLKGRCFINVDKFGDHPAEIIEKIKRHDMKDQIILKCSPNPAQLDIIETYAPDIQFLPVISKDGGVHEMMKTRNINYIGSELLFKTMDDELASAEYREKLHKDGKLCWVNTIVYSYKAVLAAFHSDDTALAGDPEYGWGWCADNFDIIQTDWIGPLSAYLEKTGRRFRK